MKRILLILTLSAAFVVACSPSGSSADPGASEPALESIPAESMPVESTTP